MLGLKSPSTGKEYVYLITMQKCHPN